MTLADLTVAQQKELFTELAADFLALRTAIEISAITKSKVRIDSRERFLLAMFLAEANIKISPVYDNAAQLFNPDPTKNIKALKLTTANPIDLHITEEGHIRIFELRPPPKEHDSTAQN